MNKNSVKIYLAFLLASLFASCEEEVTLNLKDYNRLLVVESVMYYPSGNIFTVLSYSQSFYDTTAVEMIKNARVTLSSEQMGSIELFETETGVFQHTHLPLRAGDSYTLTVVADNNVIKAETMLPTAVPILSITPVPNPFFGSDSTNLIVNFADIVGEDNFFRMKTRKISQNPTSEYYLIDDTFGKDGIISAPVYYRNYQSGDTAIVELFHLNKSTYNYFNGLSDNRGGSFNSISPGNPVSNMPEGVMGYFAGMGFWSDTLVIK